MPAASLTLFGGEQGWKSDDWKASDDRVRGGKSQSYFDCDKGVGRFHGVLDIKTLGGAGFASQRTTGENRAWDLSGYAGISLDVAAADSKRYTFTLKDNLLPRNPENGREQSTVSYEYDFTLCDSIRKKNGSTHVFIPWKDLQPTYRGKEAREAPPVDLKSVKRMSIMMRSFFGGQEGTFSLSLRSIAAVQSPQPDLRELEEGSPGMAQKPSGWTTWPLSFARSYPLLTVTAATLVVALLYYACGLHHD